MAIGKLNFEFTCKIALSFLYFFYLILYKEYNPGNFTTEVINEKSKINHRPNYEVAILGGSNSFWGVSAQQIEKKFGATYNFSIPNEGGNFQNYSHWLETFNIKAKIIIYSPLLFWHQTDPDNNYAPLSGPTPVLLPDLSLSGWLKIIQNNNSNKSIDTHGDILKYNCNLPQPYIITTKSLLNININRFKDRILHLKTLTNSDNILIRIPPILVSKDTLYNNEIKSKITDIISDFKSNGIDILDQKIILTNDAKLFCDSAYHPNQAGREIFTQDIISAIDSYMKTKR